MTLIHRKQRLRLVLRSKAIIPRNRYVLLRDFYPLCCPVAMSGC